MGLVDRVNAWVLARIASRPGADAGPTTVAWDATGLRFADDRGQWAVGWQDVVDAVAYHREQVADRTLCLTLAFRDGRFVEFNEAMAVWPALLRELPAQLPLCVSPDHALAQLAADPSARVRLLSR